MKLFKDINQEVNNAIDQVLTGNGANQIDDSLLTKQTSDFPYAFYYDSELIVELHSIDYNKENKKWSLDITKHFKSGAIESTIVLK